jgi:hypothetical protein
VTSTRNPASSGASCARPTSPTTAGRAHRAPDRRRRRAPRAARRPRARQEPRALRRPHRGPPLRRVQPAPPAQGRGGAGGLPARRHGLPGRRPRGAHDDPARQPRPQRDRRRAGAAAHRRRQPPRVEAGYGGELPADLRTWIASWPRELVIEGLHLAHVGPLPEHNTYDQGFYLENRRRWIYEERDVLEGTPYRSASTATRPCAAASTSPARGARSCSTPTATATSTRTSTSRSRRRLPGADARPVLRRADRPPPSNGLIAPRRRAPNRVTAANRRALLGGDDAPS